jgi:hypothetical protein
MKGLPFFYIGDTAPTDKVLKRWFGKEAGQVWIFINVILLMITI